MGENKALVGKKMTLTLKCKCGSTVFIVRSDPDGTPLGDEKDMLDIIYECDKCHTLYRCYLKPIKFVELKED